VSNPGYWMSETGSVLRPAVEAYLRGEDLSPVGIAAVRAYLRQWMAGPWRGPGIADLRSRVEGLTTRQAIDAWLDDAFARGIDPL
jgi:hypothetical protein